MISQRVGLTALRRAAVQPGNIFPRAAAASLMQCRPASSTVVSHGDAQAQLAAQRLKRPVSPHLSIYKYEQTWFGGSAWQRITGASFACGLYGFSLLYLVAPVVGLHLESASIASFVATLPALLKGGIKFVIARPFTFHAFNGVRHLIMDSGFLFNKNAIFYAGWGTWGASVIAGLGLAMFW